MKKKLVIFICSMLLSAAACTASAEDTAAVPETAQDVNTPEKAAQPDISLAFGEDTLAIKNDTGLAIASAVLEKENLVLTEEGGTAHTFENADPSVITDPVLTEQNSFFYLSFTDDAGKERTIAEAADEKAFAKEQVMYMLDDAYLRADMDGDSEILAVAKRGEEITVLGAAPKWYHVKLKDLEGYVSYAYLSTDKEQADQAVKAQEAAIAEAEAAAAAAAAAAAQQAAGSSGGKKIVSKQKFPDCDGSGHGYYEIRYSDGSTAIQNY